MARFYSNKSGKLGGHYLSKSTAKSNRSLLPDATKNIRAVNLQSQIAENWSLRGKSAAKLIPVNVDATSANAEILAGRLKFFDKTLALPLWGTFSP
ncbi:hypothetical protein MPL1032_200007 [Mesorhizobium plurifarium]|uniref:Uncharacterized protein n=1 Tax=Mesorhizobium plurifarium TaxID=69974 RepID=A0A0K2VYQ9_MESPL|nr:hypothetical protein MPL1032_200007 [Mesorhizobium plurifarium]